MSDLSGDPLSAATSPPRHDADREWWGEPDPVELFAAGLELALRQLRVEVAGLRAERDGLRLEVEGLRAKLVIAQEQLASRDSLADTVRQLKAAVARLTIGQAAGAPEPVTRPAPLVTPADLITVLEQPAPRPATPIAVEPVVEPVPPAPTEVTPVLAEPAPEPPQPSAIEQLKARGLWPLAPTTPAARPEPAPAPTSPFDAVPPAAEPLVVPEREREPAPYQRSTPTRESVVNWDRASTRRTPVVIDSDRVRPDATEEPAKPRSAARKIATGALGALGALVVVTILLVSVGPRVLPYQTYFVRSGSMEPTIGTGSMVVLTKVDGSQLQPGDIITFKNPDDESVLVTHRIVEIETTDQGRVFVTKGDANADVDAWRVPASGTGWKYKFNVPVIGYVFGYLGTPQARLGLLVVPALILGLLAVLDIWRPKPDEK